MACVTVWGDCVVRVAIVTEVICVHICHCFFCVAARMNSIVHGAILEKPTLYAVPLKLFQHAV